MEKKMEKNEQKIFTKEELAKYDGKDGRPAYVAISGIIYDLSEIFTDGLHFLHKAGLDLTEEFESEHPQELLSRFPVVGKLK